MVILVLSDNMIGILIPEPMTSYLRLALAVGPWLYLT